MGKASRNKKERRDAAPTSPTRDRRRRMERAAFVGALVVLVVVLLVTLGGKDGDDAVDVSSGAPAGVETFEGLSQNHVDGDVEYPQAPPVGGDHSGAWQNCGVYREPVPEEQAVHSLEHGAVWITYSPSAPDDVVDRLAEKADGETHVLVSPFADQDDDIVLSAWGAQLRTAFGDEGAIDDFIASYQEGAQAPEPGAPCSGALGTPE